MALVDYNYIKISALPVATTPTGSEILPIVQGGTTKRITVAQIQGSVVLDWNALLNVPANITAWQGIAPTSRANSSLTITAGTGLTGGGDLTANRSLSIATTGVTAQSYGGTSAIPVITVNAQGQITSAFTVSPAITWTAVTGKPNSFSGYNILMNSGVLVGRGTAGFGNPEEITVGSGLQLVGTTLSATAGGGGSVTSVNIGTTSTGVTVGGGPITGSGTLTVDLNTNLQNWAGIGTASKADLASPAFTGNPTATTQLTADNSTRLATTAFVKAQGYTANAGTVTSVATSGSTGLTTGGSPITGSGTLTFTLSANLQSWSGIAPASKADISGAGFTGAVTGTTFAGSGDMTSGQNFVSSTTSAALATTGAGSVYLRPNGTGSGVGQVAVASNGNVGLNGSGASFPLGVPTNGALFFIGDNGAGRVRVASVNTTNSAQLPMDLTASTFTMNAGLYINGGAQVDCSASTSNIFEVTQPGSSPSGSFIQANSPGSSPGFIARYGTTKRRDIQFLTTSIFIGASTGTASPTNGLSIAETGVCTAPNFVASSDERKKTDIATIKNAGDIVSGLRGVTYKWKEDGRKDTGVIAQEVQAMLPEVVHEAPDGTLAVDHGHLVGVLIEAIKELQLEVAKLKGNK